MSAENENPEEDPMIGDILSSIKSIINEDDDTPSIEAADDGNNDDSLDDDPLAGLNFDEDFAIDPVSELSSDSDPVPNSLPEDPPEPTPLAAVPAMAMMTDDLEDSIISDVTADIGIQQFVKLNNMIRMGNSNITLSDIVRSLLRPMLREWLDENLPTMVEQKVEYEIKRLVNRVDDQSS